MCQCFISILPICLFPVIYFSTDEVFGPALGNTLFKEWDRHKPTNPYSASKSAAEQICVAYENIFLPNPEPTPQKNQNAKIILYTIKKKS